MHLVLIISSLNVGGAERVLSNLANYWSKKGHRVSLLTLASPSAVPYYELHPEIELIQLDLFGEGLSVGKRILSVMKRLWVLRQSIKRLAPDAIISFVDIVNILTLIASINLNIPIIISERTDPNVYKIPQLYDWLRSKVYPYCYKLIIQTQSVADYFPRKFREFINIIPNPVKVPLALKSIEGNSVEKIVTVGRLVESKDHQLLIRVFSKIMQSYPHLSLTIYGEGPEYQNLQKLIDELNLRDYVFLPGAVQNIQAKLLDADLFIFPSKYEGFPNALCEAMAVGLPVIVSNCSGNIAVVQDGIDGRVFSIGDQDRLEQLMIELIEDQEQRLRLAMEAKKIAERFSEDKVYQMWDKTLNDAVKS